MRGTLAVYQKELATYFRSPIAYYVVAVFLLGTGYFFLYNVFLTGETTMAGTLQNMGILLLTLAPVISMRLFSAEYGAGTAELLLTLPLTPWQIVLGKYLGAVTILLLISVGDVGLQMVHYPIHELRGCCHRFIRQVHQSCLAEELAGDGDLARPREAVDDGEVDPLDVPDDARRAHAASTSAEPFSRSQRCGAR